MRSRRSKAKAAPSWSKYSRWDSGKVKTKAAPGVAATTSESSWKKAKVWAWRVVPPTGTPAAFTW
jgi:hypothetical protein